jgi:galactokinase
MRIWAPGRINLIGEHTDYSGGLVLPAAIDLGLTIEARPRHRDILLSSADFGQAEPFAADGSGAKINGWGRFAQSVAAELAALGRPPVGIEASVSSTLPSGTGLSSSAALEIGIALALCAVGNFELDAVTLAETCRQAELRAVGVPCGILDQAASLLGKPRHAIMLDCRSVEYSYVYVPCDAAFLIVDSGVDRQLEHTGYATRRNELRNALARIGTDNSRGIILDELDSLDDVLYRRVRHVVTENERVMRFASALKEHDLPAAGRLISASHASLRDDYEVSTPELDETVSEVEAHGAFGARLLGGGFGGSVLALIDASRVDDVAAAVAEKYGSRRVPIIVHASAGAHVDAYHIA